MFTYSTYILSNIMLILEGWTNYLFPTHPDHFRQSEMKNSANSITIKIIVFLWLIVNCCKNQILFLLRTDDTLGVWTVISESESQCADESSFNSGPMMNFLIYLLLMPETLGSEGKGVSLESDAKAEKWSVGSCLLVSMQAELFLRIQAQSNRASRNV